MSIELTTEQAEAVFAEGEEVSIIDPRAKQTYRLVREEDFRKLQAVLFDDADYREYLEQP